MFKSKGDISLDPLFLSGNFDLKNGHLNKAYEYFRDQVNLEISNGQIDVRLSFQLDGEEASTKLVFPKIEIGLENLIVKDLRDQTEILRMPSMDIIDGKFRWPECDLSIAEVVVEKLGLDLLLDSEGILNWKKVLISKPSSSEPGPHKNSSQEKLNPRVSVDQIKIGNSNVRIEDQRFQKPIKFDLSGIALSLDEISTQPQFSVTYGLSSSINEKGSIEIQGKAAGMPPSIYFEVKLSEISVVDFQPAIEKIANLDISSGLLGLNGQFNTSRKPRKPDTQDVKFSGKIKITDFSANDTKDGNRILGFKSLSADGIQVDLQKEKVLISEIEWVAPYVKILISEEGKVNLKDILINSESDKESITTSESAPASSTTSEFFWEINQFRIQDYAADFEDRSLLITIQKPNP